MNRTDSLTTSNNNGAAARVSTTTSSRHHARLSDDSISKFAWGVGIECSFLPHINVDQFEWTQHNREWRDDFRRIRDQLEVTTVRYALPWHQIEVEPGRFDWAMADERVNFARELGIDLMMDVMHFGTPRWLPQAVGDPRFPESLERFTTEIVSRYRDRITTWCPFNEPLVSALFSGDFGFWPPFSRKWRGYMPVISRIVQGVQRSISAIRQVHPEATVMLCDAFENFQTNSPQLQNELKMRNLRRFLVLDLLAGRMDQSHPLHAWLTSFGMSQLDLDFFQKNPQMPDLIGIDYYPHSDWQIEMHNGAIRQRRSDTPIGLLNLAQTIYDRYGLPMMVTETSVDGPPISREMWLQSMVDDIKELREEGVPMIGLIWWPLFDQIDWDGALTHRIGKLHRVGLFTLDRQPDGTLKRSPTPLVKVFRELVESGDEHVGTLDSIATPSTTDDPQLPPLMSDASQWMSEKFDAQATPRTVARKKDAPAFDEIEGTDPAPGLGGESTIAEHLAEEAASPSRATGASERKATGRYGIVVFSHLRWGFVWQRPQQYLSRFARFHPVLFVEEPFFDLPPGSEPRFDLHRVMPNVTVFCPHCAPEAATDPTLVERVRKSVHEAIAKLNTRGEFDRPLLWYYSPMDSAWSLGYFQNRGIVYDCMDELSQFTGAPKDLIDNERRLMDHADVVFTGGYELWTKKSAVHPNTHFYGCGVEFEHFNRAADPSTTVPPDIDFLPRPIIGWFGVVDERVDYHLLAEVARMRPDWSLAIVGPVVKVDPNLLPHAPNLHWLGGRDYQQLPNYCRAFDVCMMCFAINKATEFINPTKALEYLATGKPVVSTPVKDVLRQYSEHLEIAATPQEFVQKVEQLLHNPDQNKIQSGLELAKKMSWENNVASMRQNITDAITSDSRRSSKAKPSPDTNFIFQHTPGS